MLRIVIVRPGATDYDREERIQGVLDIPLSSQGLCEVARTVEQLRDKGVEWIYAPATAATQQTAEILANDLSARFKKLDRMANMNFGLWQGMKVPEIRHKQPKVYRQWQEQPDNVCPPDGEMIEQVEQRIKAALAKLLRKHKKGVIALVLSEPLATLTRHYLVHDELGDLWKALANHGRFEIVDYETSKVVALSNPVSSNASFGNSTLGNPILGNPTLGIHG
jgi:broad specificity phosphatase PhoE